jgi:hypothetical protein
LAIFITSAGDFAIGAPLLTRTTWKVFGALRSGRRFGPQQPETRGSARARVIVQIGAIPAQELCVLTNSVRLARIISATPTHQHKVLRMISAFFLCVANRDAALNGNLGKSGRT